MLDLDKYFDLSFNAKRPSAFVVSVKKNKNGMLDELIEITSFLDLEYSNVSVNQRLFHYINKIYSVLRCKYCGSPLMPKPYNARLLGNYYQGTCGNVICRKKLNVDQTEVGVIKKYGVSNISQTKEWHDKVKDTNLKKRGVEWNTQSAEFINTTKECNKINQDEITRKRKLTYTKKSMEKYGVPHPRQNSKIFERSIGNWFKKKDYILPSGKLIKVQGYEPTVITNLLSNHKERDIIISNTEMENYIGQIMYTYNEKLHRYFPDIFIVSENKIIEVKSQYTYEKDIEINNLKKQACLNAGFDFEFIIIKKR
jgi:hypothetical protein